MQTAPQLTSDTNKIKNFSQLPYFKSKIDQTKNYLHIKSKANIDNRYCEIVNQFKLECIHFMDSKNLEKCFIVSSCGSEYKESNKSYTNSCELPIKIENLEKDSYTIIHNHTNETPPSKRNDIEYFLQNRKVDILHTLTTEYDYILSKTQVTVHIDKNSIDILRYVISKIEIDVKHRMSNKIEAMRKNIEIEKKKKNFDKIELIEGRLDIEYKFNVIKMLSKFYHFNFERKKYGTI